MVIGIHEFSDVFGPLPVPVPVQVQPSNETNKKESENGITELIQRLDLNSNRNLIGVNDFEVLKVVGKGGFAKVYQVKKKGSIDEIYAMKVIRKDKIIQKDHVHYINLEREILSKVDHPFITKLIYSFQTKYRLYLVMDFVNGGELLYQLDQHGLFKEDLGRLYAAEIVSAIAYLHDKGIMHRDLKPENVLLGSDGHVMLTDFGLAKQFDDTTRTNSMVGTIEYIAPEIILGKGHSKAVDWWSVGILIYEMLSGELPFTCRDKYKLQKKIINDKMKLPKFLSREAHSLLKGLLQKEPSKRLGSGANGADEIRRHRWFKGINWKKLERREIEPSFKPIVGGKECVVNIDEEITNMPILDSPATTPKLGENKLNLFKDF
ncbi:unnamed protein product [Amaranthus hypochondriacus]